MGFLLFFLFFFFNDTATTEIYTLSLHDALPISAAGEASGTPQAEGGEIANEFGAAGGEAGSEAGAEGGRGGAGGGGGGRGFFGGANRGPSVDPGEYKVTIALAGKTDSRTFTVEEDPRVQFSSADRTKRRQAIDTLVTLTKQADEGRRKAVAMNTALTGLTDSWKQPNAPAVPEPVKKAVDDLAARVKKIAARFEQQGGGRGAGGSAGPPPPYTPPPVPQKISRLMFAIDGY